VGANPSALAANVTVGGGDSNLASDASNNLYFIDLWLGDSSTAVSHDAGANWTGVPFGTVPLQDRPWVSADPRPGNAGTVYSVTEQLPSRFQAPSPAPSTRYRCQRSLTCSAASSVPRRPATW
jgi:hypothetical protein